MNPYYGYGQQYVPEGYEVKSKYDWKMPAIGAGLAFAGSIPQLIEAQRLKRERERLLKEGAPGLSDIEQEQIANARARAASSLAPGYAQEMEGIAQQQGDIIAAGKRGVATPSNLMNLLSRLNIQGQAARRNLAMRGAQEQRRAQGDLMNVSMSADARRENRMRRWEDDLAAMDAARRQYATAPFMAPLQGAMAFMQPADKYLAKTKTETPEEDLTPDRSKTWSGNVPPGTSFFQQPQTFAPKEPFVNPYDAYNVQANYPNVAARKPGGPIFMAPQTADMGPGATPATGALGPTPTNPMGQSYLDRMLDPMSFYYATKGARKRK